jgi:hypothetical protein
MMKMIFSMKLDNIKVVYNLLILVVLNFHDFRPTSLGVMNFRNFLSDFACVL